MSGRDDDLPFRIVLWDDAGRHIEEVIALASDYAIACGAYDEAVKRQHGKLITLRQKARVIKQVPTGGTATTSALATTDLNGD